MDVAGTISTLLAIAVWALAVIPIVLAIRLGARFAASTLRAPGILIDQRRRDSFARELFVNLKTGEPVRDFALYLRPFSTDHSTRLDLDFEQEKFSTSIEGFIAEALQHEYPVVSLGEPTGFDRPGTMNPGDADWRTAFELLAKHAKLIVVIPLLKEGTFWEILTIRESGYLAKTLFVVPPTNVIRKVSTEGVTRAIDASRRGLKSRDIPFPEFDRKGGLFRVGSDGACRTVAPFPNSVLQMRVDCSRLLTTE
jgi:hypothetical protein